MLQYSDSTALLDATPVLTLSARSRTSHRILQGKNFFRLFIQPEKNVNHSSVHIN